MVGTKELTLHVGFEVALKTAAYDEEIEKYFLGYHRLILDYIHFATSSKFLCCLGGQLRIKRSHNIESHVTGIKKGKTDVKGNTKKYRPTHYKIKYREKDFSTHSKRSSGKKESGRKSDSSRNNHNNIDLDNGNKNFETSEKIEDTDYEKTAKDSDEEPGEEISHEKHLHNSHEHEVGRGEERIKDVSDNTGKYEDEDVRKEDGLADYPDDDHSKRTATHHNRDRVEEDSNWEQYEEIDGEEGDSKESNDKETDDEESGKITSGGETDSKDNDIDGSDGKEAGSEETSGEESDGEESYGEEIDNEDNVDEETNGEESDGEESYGEEIDNEDNVDEETNGEESDGEESYGEESYGEEIDSEDNDGEETRGEESDGGEYYSDEGDGKEAGGEESDDEETEGEEDADDENTDDEDGNERSLESKKQNDLSKKREAEENLKEENGSLHSALRLEHYKGKGYTGRYSVSQDLDNLDEEALSHEVKNEEDNEEQHSSEMKTSSMIGDKSQRNQADDAKDDGIPDLTREPWEDYEAEIEEGTADDVENPTIGEADNEMRENKRDAAYDADIDRQIEFENLMDGKEKTCKFNLCVC